MARKRFFVTSFVNNTLRKRHATTRHANNERLRVIGQLLKKGKRVIVTVPPGFPKEDIEYLKSLKSLGGNIRILKTKNESIYNSNWTRDVFTRVEERFYNKDSAVNSNLRKPEHLRRIFGEGGRVINLGKINGKPSLIISRSTKEANNLVVSKEIKEEIEMLKRRGYNIFELPGHEFSTYGQKRKANVGKTFFDHLDVFVNAIPEKKILLVDPEYRKKNPDVENIAKRIGFKLITIPTAERYSYPSNFLPIGSGEVIVNSAAKKTIALLKKEGVKVYATPKEIKANLTMRGSVGCFVNID